MKRAWHVVCEIWEVWLRFKADPRNLKREKLQNPTSAKIATLENFPLYGILHLLRVFIADSGQSSCLPSLPLFCSRVVFLHSFMSALLLYFFEIHPNLKRSCEEKFSLLLLCTVMLLFHSHASWHCHPLIMKEWPLGRGPWNITNHLLPLCGSHHGSILAFGTALLVHRQD